jgi:hypothetical protein
MLVRRAIAFVFVSTAALAVLAFVAGACEPDDVPCLEAHVAGHADDLSARMQLGIALMNVATTGSATAATQALAQFDAVLAAHPHDAFARVHRGWAIVTQARDAKALTERLRLARRGFAEMDTAVQAAPADAAVRLVRAINAYQMPLALGRGEIATGDFRVLLDTLTDANKRAALTPALRRRILFHAGSFALKERRVEAIDLLERAAREPAGDPSDEQVQSMLALARREFTPHPHADAEAAK